MSNEAFKLLGVVGAEVTGADRNLAKIDKHLKSTKQGFDDADRASSKFFSNVGGGGSSSASGATRGIRQMLGVLGDLSEITQAIPYAGAAIKALGKPMTDLVRDGIQMNDFLDRSRIAFTTLTGSATVAKKTLAELQQLGDETSFGTEDLVSASQKMLAFGFDVKDVITDLRIMGDAVASVGGGADTLEGVVTALGQMKAKGKVSAEEMNQLSDRNISSWQTLALMTGKTTAELQKLAETGKLKAGPVIEMMLKGWKLQYEGLQKTFSTDTLSGQMSTLADNRLRAASRGTRGTTDELIGMAGEANQVMAGDGVASLADTTNKASTAVVASMHAVIKTMITGNMTELGVTAIQSLGGGMVSPDALKTVTDAATTVVTTAVEGVKTAADMHSPSRVFMALGRMMAHSVGLGFQQGLQGAAQQDIQQTMREIEEEYERITGQELQYVLGQTNTHNRLRLDHRGAADVQLVPGTPQGDVLERLLRARGLQFIPMDGVSYRNGRQTSTGPHYHIGEPSHNLPRGVNYPVGTILSDAYIVDEARPGNEPNAPARFGRPGVGTSSTRTRGDRTGPVIDSATTGDLQAAEQTLDEINQQMDELTPKVDMVIATLDEIQPVMRATTPFIVEGFEAAADRTGKLDESVKKVSLSAQELKANFESIIGANVSWTEDLKTRLLDIQESMPTLRAEMTETFTNLPQQAGSIFGNAVRQWDGTFKGFFQSVLQGFGDMLREISAQLMESAVTKLLLKIGLSALGSLAGGAAGGAAGAGGGTGGFTGGWGMATGGTAYAGEPLLVGENGPELFTPPTGGHITPYGPTSSLLEGMGGGGPTIIHVHVHGVTDARSFIQSEGQIGHRLGMAMESTRKRLG